MNIILLWIIFSLISSLGVSTGGRLRGSLCFILGVISLLLLDNDVAKIVDHPEGQQHHGVKHLIYYIISWTGLSDHEVIHFNSE